MKLRPTKSAAPIVIVVDYHGLGMNLAPGERYLATDADGSVYAYRDRPHPGAFYWVPQSGGGQLSRLVTMVDLEGQDWITTLAEYDEEGVEQPPL